MSLLHSAIIKGNLEEVEFLTGLGTDANALTLSGSTSISTAILYNESTDILAHLIDVGANLEVKDFLNRSPLEAAIFFGKYEMAELLIEKGAKVNANSEVDLVTIIQKNRTELASLLFKKGANVNAKDESGFSPLIEAIKKGNIEIVKLLIDYNVDLNQYDEFLSCPLETAMNRGKGEIARLLLKNGVKIDSIDEVGNSPLHLTAFAGNLESVELLLEYGAKVNIQNSSSRDTPLHVAVYKRDENVVGTLMKYGACINMQNLTRGEGSQLEIALNNPDKKVFKILAMMA